MNIVAGYNFQLVAIELIACAVWIALLRKESPRTPEFYLTLGLLLHSSGVAIRIGWWAVASHLTDHGGSGIYPDWATEWRDWLFFSVQMSMIGVTLQLMPYFKGRIGNAWWAPVIGTGVVVFVIASLS